MKKMTMAVGLAAVQQVAETSRSADLLFPVSICLTMARPVLSFLCDNVTGLSLRLLSGDGCPVYGIQASRIGGNAEPI